MIFVGDDWAEDHHDIHIMDETGHRQARRRLPEGLAGIAALHELVASTTCDLDPSQVVVGIETDRGLWVHALIAAGYQVFAINHWRRPDIATATASLGQSPIAVTPSCSLTWCALTATTTALSPGTPTTLTASRY